MTTLICEVTSLTLQITSLGPQVTTWHSQLTSFDPKEISLVTSLSLQATSLRIQVTNNFVRSPCNILGPPGDLMGFPGDLFRFLDIHNGPLNVHIWPSKDFIDTLLGLIGLTLGPNGPLMAFKVPFWDLEYHLLGLSGPLGSSNDLPFRLMTL